MKDGIGTIYITADDFFEFIREKAETPETTSTIIGRPRWINPEEIEIDYAFSESEEVTPEDWGGKPGERVKEITAQWDDEGGE